MLREYSHLDRKTPAERPTRPFPWCTISPFGLRRLLVRRPVARNREIQSLDRMDCTRDSWFAICVLTTARCPGQKKTEERKTKSNCPCSLRRAAEDEKTACLERRTRFSTYWRTSHVSTTSNALLSAICVPFAVQILRFPAGLSSGKYPPSPEIDFQRKGAKSRREGVGWDLGSPSAGLPAQTQAGGSPCRAWTRRDVWSDGGFLSVVLVSYSESGFQPGHGPSTARNARVDRKGEGPTSPLPPPVVRCP